MAAQFTASHCEFRRNRVDGGSFLSAGGAISVHPGGLATLEDCTLNENVASGGGLAAQGGAVALMIGAGLIVRNAELCDNVAAAGGQYVQGGALFLNQAAQATISDSVFCRNSANSTGAAHTKVVGGAVFLFTGATTTVTGTTFRENAAVGGSVSDGGAVGVSDLGHAYFDRVTFLRNYVSGGTNRNSGGALILWAPDFVRVSNSHFHENQALGQYPDGGALHCRGNKVEIENCTFGLNGVFSTQGLGVGGAVFLEKGILSILACQLYSNRAVSGAAIRS
jgi:hypothetical protein